MRGANRMRAAGHRDAAREDQVLRRADLDEGAVALVRRAAHHQVAGQREPHRVAAGSRDRNSLNITSCSARRDGRVGIGVADRAADQVATGLRAAHDLLDPVGRGVGVAVDEGEDVAPGHGDPGCAGACGRERAPGSWTVRDRRQRPGRRPRRCRPRPSARRCTSKRWRGVLRSEGCHAPADGRSGIERRHDHRYAWGSCLVRAYDVQVHRAPHAATPARAGRPSSWPASSTTMSTRGRRQASGAHGHPEEQEHQLVGRRARSRGPC